MSVRCQPTSCDRRIYRRCSRSSERAIRGRKNR
jgi:hypothetical protein